MRWIFHNWVAIVILAAIATSFVVSDQESARRDRAQAAQLVTGCLRTSEARILNAAYKQKTSDVRRAAGSKADEKAADEYQLFALGEVALVPLTPHVAHEVNPRALVGAVQVGHDTAGEKIYRLRPEARKLLREGCVKAYS